MTLQIEGRTVSNTNPVPVRKLHAVMASASFMPAAAAYTGGDIVDVAKEMAWAYAESGLAVPQGAVLRIIAAVLKIDEAAIISGETSYTLPLYSATPPSVQADNAAWTLASADLAAYLGDLALGTPADRGASSYIKTDALNIIVKLAAASSSMWAELITVGGFTATAVARQVTLYGELL